MIEAYIRGWFLGSGPDDIRLDNIREFLLWAFFEREDDGSIEEDEDALEDLHIFIRQIESRIGRRFELGRSEVRSLRLTLDDVESKYRSSLWYAIVFIVDLFTHTLLVWKGFQYYAATSQQVFPPRPQCKLSRHRSTVSEMGYWYSPHQCEHKLPLVFFHGIGIGLLVYIEYLATLLKTGTGKDSGIGIIAVEMMPISFRLTNPPPSKVEFLEQMSRILDHHGWTDFAISSHSYGSVPVTHILSSPALQPRVRSLVLIDPVTPLLHLPDVAYNFTRRYPRRANEWQLYYFASTDPGVAHCLGRHFFWRENIVWREELRGEGIRQGRVGRNVAAILAGRDLILRPDLIENYLTGSDSESVSEKVEVIVFPHLDHAQVFDSAKERQQLVDLTRSYCAGSSLTLEPRGN
ncbi:alpha/beta hydrolase fold domain-containing protein [Sarocladium implicatum]|nr:alpha/beta hydrolase fold domain-containing protein [Sarocladium implicatum]